MFLSAAPQRHCSAKHTRDWKGQKRKSHSGQESSPLGCSAGRSGEWLHAHLAAQARFSLGHNTTGLERQRVFLAPSGHTDTVSKSSLKEFQINCSHLFIIQNLEWSWDEAGNTYYNSRCQDLKQASRS